MSVTPSTAAVATRRRALLSAIVLVTLFSILPSASAQCEDLDTQYSIKKCYYSDDNCTQTSQEKCQNMGHEDCEDGCYEDSNELSATDLCVVNATFLTCSRDEPDNITSFFWNCTNSTIDDTVASSTSNFVIGAVLAFIGSTGESLGFTFMKLAHDREHARAMQLNRKEMFYLKNKEWWMAMAVFTVGNILDFVAFSMTGQTIVILVGCWALCVNLITAPKILKEKRKLMDLVSIVIIFTGIGLAVGGSSHTDREWTTEQLVARYADPASAILLAIIFLICLATFVITRLYHRKHPMDVHAAVELHNKQKRESNQQAGIKGVEEEGDFTPPIPPSYIRVAHVMLAAFTAVLTVCSAKASSEMLFQSFSDCLGSQFTGAGVVIILVFIASIVLQLHFIQTSLMVNEALFHIPVFYVFWQIGSTVTGGVLYLEFDGLEYWSFILFGVGVSFLLFGIKLASARLAAVESVMAEDATVKRSSTDSDTMPSGIGEAMELEVVTTPETPVDDEPRSPHPRPLQIMTGSINPTSPSPSENGSKLFHV